MATDAVLADDVAFSKDSDLKRRNRMPEPMYLFFDTETNGLPKRWKAPVTDVSNWPRLVQIAWVLFDEAGNELDRNDHIIRPDGFTISRQSSAIHRITTARANAEGVELRPVLDEFEVQLGKATYLVAHNMSFDEKIVGAEFLRNGMPNHIASKQKICTMKSMVDYVAIPGSYGYKWPKLGELHQKLFGHGFEEAHDAAADINATAKCFWEARRLGVL